MIQQLLCMAVELLEEIHVELCLSNDLVSRSRYSAIFCGLVTVFRFSLLIEYVRYFPFFSYFMFLKTGLNEPIKKSKKMKKNQVSILNFIFWNFYLFLAKID